MTCIRPGECAVCQESMRDPFGSALTALRAADEPNYETQIRPILKEHCTHCHGEEEKLKGGIDLRLRRFMAGKTEDGDPVLTPGKPELSALFTLTRD